MTALIVIPARFGSKRLLGKPLVEIAGRTLLARVVDVARRAVALAGDCEMVVATDDPRIAAHAQALDCTSVMTSPDIRSGSGRAYAAAALRGDTPGIVVNLQGDAPFIPPELVASLIAAARKSDAACVTPVVRLDWAALDAMRAHKAQSPFSGTTCIRAADGRALWFSKMVVPSIRDEAVLRTQDPFSPCFATSGSTPIDSRRCSASKRRRRRIMSTLEGLEQLRFLELGLDIQTIEVAPPSHAMSGIDTREDVALAEALIRRFGDPFGR